MFELFYDVAPGYWSSEAVRPMWRQQMPMKRLQLISRGPIVAVAEYENRFPGDNEPSGVLVAFTWYGARPKPPSLPGELRSTLDKICTEQDPKVASPPAPCGLVVLAADRLAGLGPGMTCIPMCRGRSLPSKPHG